MADSLSKLPLQPVRVVAANALNEVINGASLSRVLPRAMHAVKDSDRALLSEICYGSCRFYPIYQDVLGRLLKKPLRKRDANIQALLIIALYQLHKMRIKPHAIVDESVKAAKFMGKPGLAGMVNGVLRRFQREQQKLINSDSSNFMLKYCLPKWLVDQLNHDWPDRAEAIAQALLEQPPMVLRVNQTKTSLDEYLEKLAENEISAGTIEGVNSAIVLDRAMSVEKLPGFFEGTVSVQDAGAQMAAQLLAAKSARVLDACAAPGGKTCHMLEIAPKLDMTAIDIDPARTEKIQENLDRLGLNAEVFTGDAGSPGGEWAERQYDAILLDVPCSASGVIRRHPDIKLLRQKKDIAGLVSQQRTILEKMWPLLKPGGRLLYATCSIISDENEKQINWFIKQHNVVELPLKPSVKHVTKSHGVQIVPGDLNMDGFYYALLQKPDEK